MSEHGVISSIRDFHSLGSEADSDVRSIDNAQTMKYMREIYIQRRIKEGATRKQAQEELRS
jgi:hypothetical protein